MTVCASLALAGPASAAQVVGGLIGGPSGGSAGSFFEPRDAATYFGTDANAATDKLFVVDAFSGNQRVQRLDANGSFDRLWGRDVIAFGAPGDQGNVAEVCAVAERCQAPASGGAASGAAAGEFDDPQGVAVDQDAGLVYVADRDNRRVQVFDLDGQFERMWGFDVIVPGAPNGNGTGFEVCDVEAGNAKSDCKQGVAGSGVGQLGTSGLSNTYDIAVSPGDGNPATGKVFVADTGNQRVNVYDLDGSSPESFGGPSAFAASQPRKLAVDAQGIVYASDAQSSGEVERYDYAGVHGPPAFVASITATNSVTPGPLLAGSATGGDAAQSTVGLEVDPATGNLYVARDPATGETVVQELASPGALVPPAAVTDTHGTGEGFGAVNGFGYDPARDDLYMLDRVDSVSNTGVFALSEAPAVLVAPVAGLPNVTGPDSVTLSGTVDAGDGVVGYRFEVSTNGVDFTPVSHKRYVAGSGAKPVSVGVTGLDSATSYTARLVAFKQTSATTADSLASAPVVFATPAGAPVVTTLGSAGRTDRSAELRGRIDPGGATTAYHFEYGEAGGPLDQQAPIPAGSAGSGNLPVLVTQTVEGLDPETDYEYRLVATNSVDTVEGGVVPFTTEATPGAGTVQDRGYELVTPPYKVGGIGASSWYVGPGDTSDSGFGAYNGERFAAQGSLGSTLLDSPFAFATDWALADRIDDKRGWQSHSPVTRSAVATQSAKFIWPQAATEDLSKLAWRTNNDTIDIFEETIDWPSINPTFMSDWDGRWEIFGPTDPATQVPVTAPSGVFMCDFMYSGDGSASVCSPQLISNRPGISGLAGPGDPTRSRAPDPETYTGRSVYIADISDGLTDSFEGTDERELVNVCADGTQLPAVDGAGDLDGQICGAPVGGDSSRPISDRGATIQAALTSSAALNSMENVISRDGSRVFFIAPDPEATGVPDGPNQFCSGTADTTLCPPQLYVRQRNTDGTIATRWISRAVDSLFGDQDATLTGTVRFEGATADGDKVFFRTSSPLTPDDPNSTGSAPVTAGSASDDSWDLYLYDLPDGPDGDPATADADPAGGELTRISAGPDGDGDCNSPLAGSDDSAALRFASADGSVAYFSCAAPLAGVNGIASNGTITEPGGTPVDNAASNVYMYDASKPVAERWRFVARMPRGGNSQLDGCATRGIERSSPLGLEGALGSGQYGFLAPVSNCVQGTADGGFISFWTRGQLLGDDPDATSADMYAYDADSDELMRLSATTDGVGGTYPCGSPGTGASAVPCNADPGFESSRVRTALALANVATRPLAPGDRVVAFQSASRLVAEDTDDAYDVYEWRNGTLRLASTGQSATDGALYRGMDATGRNLYFATIDRLTWQDHDAVVDVYTSRIDGGIDEPPAPSLCDVLAHGCRGAGGDLRDTSSQTEAPGGGGNAVPVTRPSLVLERPGRKALRRAARTGVVRLPVKVGAAGRVRAVVRARVRGPNGRLVRRQVAARTLRVGKPGSRTLALRLSRAARRQLADGGRLALTVRVTSTGSAAKSMRLVLKGRR